ncbi:RidA family protein [Aquimarina sp. AD10]|uniref:Enamine deaminase RidA n=1 Tax=Aquimarina aggregata TaxID=1642818 RepID=A0A163D4R4_9FLAO|nr:MULTISPECIES: RidA family protein [Aquimarina]AXT62586.1 RidA family protein [Aquimarina sp. AD10]KZS42994.1 enamine deaminase RidA [Aquimarina aggregata]RKM97770.1 RidA family protein [Aquimarina sp. AD10]
MAQEKATILQPEYYQRRASETENGFGYSFAVKIGNLIKASGAVSMDEEGKPTAIGDYAQQMKNCYADIEKMLIHYGCTFDDIIVENIYTTNMTLFMENLEYRKSLYTENRYPKSTWLGVKELAMPELMIEIEVEVYIP